MAQILAKCSSSALFANIQLISVSITQMVLVISLSASVASRLIATWIISVMSYHIKNFLYGMFRIEEVAKSMNIIFDLDFKWKSKHVIASSMVNKSRHLVHPRDVHWLASFAL